MRITKTKMKAMKVKNKITRDVQSFGKSSYWLSNNSDNLMESENSYKLAASKRAIGNFVNIVTGQSIPVKYATTNSYTDGKTVTIGSDIKTPADFDTTVGLALHEASHIILSDFDMLRDLYKLVPTETEQLSIKVLGTIQYDLIKGLWNWIEDRRIDHYIYTTSPGYKEYYHSMYDKYFHNSIIDKGLLSSEYRDETIESYMFRIINLTNPNTDLGALLKLKDIYNTIDLRNIGRLKSSKDTLDVAIQVFNIILSTLDGIKSNDDSSNSSNETNDGNGTGNGSVSMNAPFGEETDDTSNDSNDGDDTTETDTTDGTSNDSTDGDSTDGDDDSKPLSDALKKKLDNWLGKQVDFVMGDVRKKKISAKQSKEIKLIEESNSNIVNVEYEGYNKFKQKVECIVVKKLTEELLTSSSFPLKRGWSPMTVSVDDGLRLGTIIGKRLQIRNESKTTIYNRQKNGRLDKRMISSLGYGNESVFQYSHQDSYKKANLHISVDASSSMDLYGKWQATIVNVVALCKAVDMIPNLDVQVSFRATSSDLPYVVIAYDSRVDKISKVKSMFSRLSASGTTPEGLLFAAILDTIPRPNQELDSYFLNISDGAPYFGNYQGENAYRHTKEQVSKLEAMGINVLSYFISESGGGSSFEREAFTKMYGKSSKFINVQSATDVVKTMNELFLTK